MMKSNDSAEKSRIARADRIEGCLLAGALGDAIGAHYEGEPATSDFTIPIQLRVTDDTQLTIATCESIIESASVKPELIADRFAHWFRERRLRGIGASTHKALSELVVGGHWALVGATGERSAGSGAAMRVAPLAFLLDPDLPSDSQTIRDVCRITHRNDEAYIGALAILSAIRHVVGGHELSNELPTVLIDSLPDSRVRDRLIEVGTSSVSFADFAERYGSSGYVVDSVPLAILAAITSHNLLETIQRIVECGGDTDTIASMYGNIYGAAHGVDILPFEILERVDAVGMVRKIARDFSRAATTGW